MMQQLCNLLAKKGIISILALNIGNPTPPSHTEVTLRHIVNMPLEPRLEIIVLHRKISNLDSNPE